MTVTVGEAFDNLGHLLADDETVCVASLQSGAWRERSLHDVREEPIGANRYYSTGTFRRNQAWRRDDGRTLKNVRRILGFPFDFDLKDFLGLAKDDLYDLDDDELQTYLDALQHVVEEMFGRLNMPIHRLDATGYGLAAHVMLPGHQPDMVPELKRLHAGIVRKINGLFGGTLADPQVSDAGTRVMRLVPCANAGTYEDGRPAPARTSRTISQRSGRVDEATIRNAAGEIAWNGVPVNIPATGDGLTRDEARIIIDTYRPYHQQGHKHLFGLAIAGQLAKAWVPEDQALAIVGALAKGDRKPWDRERAVQDTYTRIRSGIEVSGYYRLQGIVPDETIEAVDKTLARLKQASEPKLTLLRMVDRSGDERPSLFKPPLPPPSAFYGWHGRWRDLVSPTTESADAFHIGASLAWQGAMMGRRISTRYAGDNVYPSMYHCLVGPTGNSRKDTAVKRVLSLPTMAQQYQTSLINLEYRQINDIASREALVAMLARTPNLLLFVTEIVALFKNASREATSTLLDGLITVWDTPTFMHNNSLKAQEGDANVARDPFMTIIGGIQPDRLSREMTETMTSSGLGNRMAFFMGVAKARIPRTPDIDPRTAADLYGALSRSVYQYPRGTILRMDEDAGRRWDTWYLDQHEEDNEVANDMKIRHADMIQKWALCYAVSDGAQAIHLPHLEAAIDLCTWMWRCVAQVLPTWGTTDERKIEERILTVLEQRGQITKRDLNRYVRGRWTATQFAKVFRAMEDNQQIVMDATKRYVSTPDHLERGTA